MPAHRWCRYAHANPSTINLIAQCENTALNRANVWADSRLSSNRTSRKGSIRNSTAPLTRCKIETSPGTGSRIWIRLRYFGRDLDIDFRSLGQGVGDSSHHTTSLRRLLEILAVSAAAHKPHLGLPRAYTSRVF